MPKNKPRALTIRSYQVGFGDCFLLTFHYGPPEDPSDDRHVLIDCGSTGMPKNAAGGLKEVALEIAHDCGGQLTALVATHRHADHINGFATSAEGDAAGDTIRGLKPKLVIQPWTEDPELAIDATAPVPANPRRRSNSLGAQKAAASLQSMQAFAELVLDEVKRFEDFLPRGTKTQLKFLGEENLANRSAVNNLMSMGAKNEYLHYGQKTGLSKLLPGVKIHVLGPPTPEQFPDVQKQRSRDNSEFWHILGASAGHLSNAQRPTLPFNPKYVSSDPPAYARWFAHRVQAAHIEQRLEIVRALDDAMNNTSLIFLFEVGGKKFLFPGDAQIENWSFALNFAKDAEANRKLLAETDFYKVGHHGSLNATPKTLWNLFEKKSSAAGGIRLSTAVSTMRGKHGSTARQTEVPRRPLVNALRMNSNFFTTEGLSKTQLSQAIEFDL